jgi:anti-sigma regulatory factor (Ser/Thr protein kinase)
MKELVIEAKLENLDTVLDFVAELPTQVTIAVEEIFVNIAHYAYTPETGSVTIRMSVQENIVIEFEDSGKPYNPLEKEDPDIKASAEEREVGGLGIFMVKKIMDKVEYRREGNKNILTISMLPTPMPCNSALP